MRTTPSRGFRELPSIDFIPQSTALLIVDMQYGCAHIDYGVQEQLERRRRIGQIRDPLYYPKRLATVAPNIVRLQRACRDRGIEVIFSKIQSLTTDGRDRGLGHRELGMHYPPGSKEAEILEELAPVKDEMVFTKTCGSVFAGTNIAYVLRNMGIRDIVIAGVVTSGCVEGAVRDAKDLGFGVMLVADACATWSAELEDAALKVLGVAYAVVADTNETIRLLEKA